MVSLAKRKQRIKFKILENTNCMSVVHFIANILMFFFYLYSLQMSPLEELQQYQVIRKYQFYSFHVDETKKYSSESHRPFSKHCHQNIQSDVIKNKGNLCFPKENLLLNFHRKLWKKNASACGSVRYYLYKRL